MYRISPAQLESIYKVNVVVDKFIELTELIKSLTKDEYDLLIRSLKNTLEEVERVE